MSGRGKDCKVRSKAKTRSARAGLQFPVDRVHRLLCKGNHAERNQFKKVMGCGLYSRHPSVSYDHTDYKAEIKGELRIQHINGNQKAG
ncbi:putative histone H2A [Schistosoma mansoni]|uniref:putative histone H2A n=1 Tax=Schistosoma mansoni TaxID=6183 RepID=UPI00022DC96C|nr:putative histone H2A [Schistosoma mansoni]|eukprot:XP_018647701.1 putative histone H2A [Schistosoma mansoni]